MEDQPKDDQKNNSGDVQNDSEQTKERSEEVKNSSETFGTNEENVQNGSEENANRSETVPNEQTVYTRTAPVCSEEHKDYRITVREAARIFEAAGTPRTERAITNWCNKNVRGITRLTACYNEQERKYYITEQSIDQVIKEEKKKQQFTEYKTETVLSAEAEELADQVRNESQKIEKNVRNGSEQEQNRSEEVPNDSEPFGTKQENVRNETTQKPGEDGQTTKESRNFESEINTMKVENANLRIQVEGQKLLLKELKEHTDKEHERHEREKLALVDRLTDAKHQIGTLEEKVLQLEAPKGPVRDAETTNEQEVEKQDDEAYDSAKSVPNEEGGEA